MKRILTTAVLIVVAVAAIGVASTQIPAPPQTRPIALVGGTIHPVEGPDIPNGTIVFTDGKITALGANATVPAGAETIDVSGKHVYPGLIDASTVIGLTEIGAVRASNDMREVGPINPNVRAEVAVNPESEIIPVTRSNGVTAVLTVPSGGILSGTSALLYLDGWTYEDMTLRAPIAMHLNWPRMSTITAWWMRQSEEEQIKDRDESLVRIRDAFADARAYWKARNGESAGGTPHHPHDSRWEAMIPVLEKRMPVIVNAGDLQQMQAAIAFGEREGIRLIVSGGYDAPLCAELLKKDDIPVIVRGIHRMPEQRDHPYDAAFTVPARLHQAGVRFCISNGGASNVRNLPYQAATAAAHGLPADEALKAITLYPAQILHVDDRIGSLAVGKDATMIVTDGDVLETPTQVEIEFMAGRRIDLSDKH
ncbi:MAG TPA: amidohydrolase family protein, partial [Acidobacteriota bacterium]|nr:amidohydrolase family protein [Acidobacteriota bacterium]